MPSKQLKFSQPMHITTVRLPQDLLTQFTRAISYIDNASGIHTGRSRSDALRRVMDTYLDYARTVRKDLEGIDPDVEF